MSSGKHPDELLVPQKETNGLAALTQLKCRAEGAAFVGFLTTTALIGSVYMIFPFVPLLFFSATYPIYRRACQCVATLWFTAAAALLELTSDVVVYGTPLAESDRVSLLICNHNCRIDWMYLWVLASRLGRPHALCIALKDSLRSAPFFGWAMQAFLFVFLSRRDRNTDLQTIRRSIEYNVHTLKSPLLFLIFPEGTDLSPSNLAASQQFAQANGLPRFEHVLYPRSAGFAGAVDAAGDKLDAVLDVTVRYTPHALDAAPSVHALRRLGGHACTADTPMYRPSESSLLGGRWPRRVALRVERRDAAEVARVGDKEVGAWLKRRWEAKEAWLAMEAEAEARAEEMEVTAAAATTAAAAAATATLNAAEVSATPSLSESDGSEGAVAQSSANSSPSEFPWPLSRRLRCAYGASLLFWALAMAASAYALSSVRGFGAYTVGASLCLALLTRRAGGLGQMEMDARAKRAHAEEKKAADTAGKQARKGATGSKAATGKDKGN